MYFIICISKPKQKSSERDCTHRNYLTVQQYAPASTDNIIVLLFSSTTGCSADSLLTIYLRIIFFVNKQPSFNRLELIFKKQQLIIHIRPAKGGGIFT